MAKIKTIDSIKNMAVFQDFRWSSSVRDGGNNIAEFKKINILYGRNYSGKTMLSRILRAMETGQISDKLGNPSFTLTFNNTETITENSLTNHGKTVRVFNEDFVRDNLRFITNPDDSIEPFAILGDENNKIEKEIEALSAEIGSKQEGNETGLYAKKVVANTDYTKAFQGHKTANDAKEKHLCDKATDRMIGIKYKPERFGDQNYNIQKLKTDIGRTQAKDYQPPTDEQLTHYETLILEKTLQSIPSFHEPKLNFQDLATESEALVTKKISKSDKIEELLKNAVLNRWVNEGRTHHKDKRDKCAFCANPISEDRWGELERHFDEESEKLEDALAALIGRVDTEKSAVNAALSIDKTRFYSRFHGRVEELNKALEASVGKYVKALDALNTQLKARRDDILNSKSFEKQVDASVDLVAAWNSYNEIRSASDTFSKSLNTEQAKARDALRLKEISDYLVAIQYEAQLTTIKGLKSKLDEALQEKNRIEGELLQKEELITSKKRELNDEEKGAKKVNEYLNNCFGHQFLSLKAQKAEVSGEEVSKRIRFEVIRDGKKAYHLSEGECSLLAFCYFLAKLNDIDTKDSKPIIWIDDPISSLDGNHIFFVYSLLKAEIVSVGRFEQLFISTHNLDFLKYLKRLNGSFLDTDGKQKPYQKGYFVVERRDKTSAIVLMPQYLKDYVTEFNYLFHQIHQCAAIESIDDTNYTTFYNFANNARKFCEIYLYYKYPDQGMTEKTLHLFFGEDKIPAVFTDRINNEYSHLCGTFERGATPVEVPEMQTAARQIIEKLKDDKEQFSALLKSVGVSEDSLKADTAVIVESQ